MIVNCFQIDEALRLNPVPAEGAAEVAARSDARLWIDLMDFTPGELEEWLDALGIEDLGRRLCLEARDRAGFYPLRTEIFFVTPALVEAGAAGEVDHVAFLCKENLLLTLHRKAVVHPEKLAALEASDAWLPERSIAGLVAAVMIDQSLDLLRHTTGLRDSVSTLEVRMDRDTDSVEAEEILDARALLVVLGALATDGLPTLQALTGTDKPFFRLGDARDYMHCALANLKAADGSLTWLNQRIGALRSGFEMHAQDKTNSRLGMLTILSAIFMPVTLMAGIWGMNFEVMPELTTPFAYPIGLAAMAVVGSGMYFFFRRTGWFG